MKTQIFIITTILAFHFSISYANNNTSGSGLRPDERAISYLAPVSPAEADFSDLLPDADASLALLIPVTPKEASFEEEISAAGTETEPALNRLEPVAPAAADFEESL